MKKENQLEEAFGTILRELRLKTGLSQEKLGLESGLDRTYISLLERGLRQPSLNTLFLLSVPLGMTPSKIVALVEKEMKA